MNEQEKKKIDEISNELAAISGGLQGIGGGSRERYTTERLFEYSYKLQDLIGELNKLIKGA